METTSKTMPESSLRNGIVISLVLGAVFGAIVYAATTWIWQPLALALSIGVGGYVAKELFVKGYQLISIPANYVGVATRFGDKLTGAIYEAGDHWGFPGVSGAIPVDMRHRRIDLTEKFSASAGDASDVGVDGFVFVQIVDAAQTINVKDLDGSVRELFESRIRLFTTTVAKAEYIVQLRDLLAQYLELEPRPQENVYPPEHKSVKERLESLPQGFIKAGGIDTLMQKDAAGRFKKTLNQWGAGIEKIEIERFDVPQVVKEANLKRATQAALMDAEKIRNTARKQMVDELVAAGVSANNAMNSVDLLLGLNVRKDVREITITDLDKVADKLGGHIVEILRGMFANRQNT